MTGSVSTHAHTAYTQQGPFENIEVASLRLQISMYAQIYEYWKSIQDPKDTLRTGGSNSSDCTTPGERRGLSVGEGVANRRG